MAAPDKYNYLPRSAELLKLASSATYSEQVQHYKKHLAKGHEALVAQFQKNTSVIQLLKARSALVDHILQSSWQRFSVDSECSLVAVGGYGREELHPYSDIDILMLLPDELAQNDSDTASLESWLAFLWDIGLEVGHSVRTIAQSHELAKQDITIATNLLEARRLVGSTDLFNELVTMVRSDDFWSSKDFFEAKVAEQRLRHSKFNDSSYNLEPNIKSNPGGLRDLHVMQWVNLKHFNSTSLHDFIDKGIFTRREYKNLIAHQQFLHKVRFAIHAITGKREDRLIFDYQKTATQWLGFEDDEHRLGVEKLMQRYYRAVMSIRNLNELFVQMFEQEYLHDGSAQIECQLDDDFYVKNRRIGVYNPDVFQEKPHLFIKIFTYIALDPEIRQIQAKTLRKIRSNYQLINNEFRNSPIAIEYLNEFLSARQMTSRGFALMKRTNVLGALIPLFSKIEGQMQFDLFHAYTVDEHTLFLLRHIIRYNKPECAQEFPICTAIMKKRQDSKILILAAIFHDIAKGRGGDHSELGADDALEFALNIGYSQQEAQHVSWLVKNHLLMSMIAQRKDISDPEVIAAFAKRVPSIEHLEFLYVLTVSDIRATNPTLWNSWKASLLQELFLATKYYLKQTSPSSNHEEMLQDTRQQVLEQFSKTGESIEPVRELLAELGDDYLLRYHPEQIIWQTEQLLSQPELPYVAIKNHRSQAGTEILIAINDEPALFARLTALLSKQGLNIQAATLFTAPNSLCLDTFIVLDESGKPLSYQHRINEIQDNLIHGLSQESITVPPSSGAVNRRLKHFDVPVEITFSHDATSNFTVLEITALDRPALLAKMGQAFKQCNVKVHSAKIVTLGEKAQDIFTISTQNDAPFSQKNDPTLATLKQTIIELLKQD